LPELILVMNTRLCLHFTIDLTLPTNVCLMNLLLLLFFSCQAYAIEMLHQAEIKLLY